ncbi:MAG: hypothetical protein E8D46_15790 [Nitrospira sp.]|nr:MAG: hypothetical protein E8D46_15790 [Nitrospira sp.]
MAFYFHSYRRYLTHDKHDPRRRWLVYEFKTPRGVMTLMQRLRVSRVKRTVTYSRDGKGHWKAQSKSRKVTEILTRD